MMLGLPRYSAQATDRRFRLCTLLRQPRSKSCANRMESKFPSLRLKFGPRILCDSVFAVTGLGDAL